MAHRNLQNPWEKCVSALWPFLACMSCAIYCSVCAVSAQYTLFDTILIAFFKNVLPASVGSTFLKNGSKHFAFKNSLFGPLKPSNDDSLAHFFGTYRSLSRSVSHFSASVALQNIVSGCSLVHFSPPEPLLQKCLFAAHLKFPFFVHRLLSSYTFVP